MLCIALFPYTTLFRSLQWMVNEMFTFGVLAVIIIFQPELRRALEQIGRGKLFSRITTEVEQEFSRRIGEVIQAVNYLAARKIDRKSTRLNSSHVAISYALHCTLSLHDALPISSMDG